MEQTVITQNNTTERINDHLFFAFGFFLMQEGMKELTQPSKQITHELFEMVDSMKDTLSDKNIKDLKEKMGVLYNSICVVETKTLEQIEEGCVDAMKDGPVALEDVSLEDPVESEQMKAFKEKWIHRLGSRHAYEEFLIDARVAALLPSEQQAIVDREMDYESIWDYGESDEDHVQTLVEEIIAETA